MCGAVHFAVRGLNPEFGACHCRMCQHWAGSALLSLTIPQETIRFEGQAHIKTFQSSDWAERAWCNKCGSGLWYRLTAGPEKDTYHMPIGLLDDTSDLTMTRQIFIDEKSEAFAFANETKNMTAQEVIAMYTPSQET